MSHIMPDPRFANIQSIQSLAPDTPDEVRSRIGKSMDQAMQMLLAPGLADDVAVLLRADPLGAETALRDEICRMGCTVLSQAFEQLDDDVPSLEIDGTGYRRMDASPRPCAHALRSDHIQPGALSSVEWSRRMFCPVRSAT